MTEFELKFQIDPPHQATVEAAVARGRSYRTRLRARYFDTADGALAAQRIVLRLRKEGGTWVQTAKAPTDGPLQRHEHNFELPPMGARELPLPRIDRHDDTPVGELVAKALRQAGHDPATVELVPLYGTDVWRTTREMRTGDALIELAFDRGEVRAGEHAHALCELEIELKHGSPQSMLELAQRWRNRYALWLDTVSKSARGERLAKGIQHGPPTKAVQPSLESDPSGPEVFRAVLNTCLAQILPNASEVAAGSQDAEHVHQLRVGIRRLRTALREMADFAPDIDSAWEAPLVGAFRALGLQRDREHLRQTVQPQIEAAGGPPVAWPDVAHIPKPADVVRGADFQTVLMDLIAASLPPEVTDDATTEEAPPARKRLRERLAKLHRQIARDGRRFEELEPVAQHRVRKRLKRLRYLGEFVAPLFGRREARHYLKDLEPAQDALGKHNDDAVAIAAYREHAAQDGRAWFAVGWLSARQPADAVECRKALDRIAEARPFWKKKKT
ncbi:CYTH and CHAD domain-containing protein [Variovorax sp. J2P1-59]|uniref:CYTH and CHAD domain-containing protein n=1 Tax=Variovorax flavidus TaxID=3053501 RepID=UPI00257810EE|nr:CYTH and CHAD domain-containing protein [Variovorax sp. J2P1-59]MDM0075917.1 CYTH and CHAD domain-containing protein [Variovorax sp. J2P1-59]